MPSGRVLFAFAAIFSLYLQLAAAALCIATVPGAAATPGLTAASGPAGAPICHGQADDDGGDHGGRHGGQHGAPCPFCSLHAHAGLAATPAPQFAAPAIAASEPAAPPAAAALPLSRRRTDAAPRGPPAAA